MKSKDGSGYNFGVFIINYISERERKIVQTMQVEGKQKDSAISYRSFNEKGQLVKLERPDKAGKIESTENIMALRISHSFGFHKRDDY
jgi:hypothetical protein